MGLVCGVGCVGASQRALGFWSFFFNSLSEGIFSILEGENRAEHTRKFPFSDNLFTLIFLINSDLSDNQRQTVVQHLALRNVRVPEYTYDQIRTLYMELLVNPRTEFDDPNVRPRHEARNSARTFLSWKSMAN